MNKRRRFKAKRRRRLRRLMRRWNAHVRLLTLPSGETLKLHDNPDGLVLGILKKGDVSFTINFLEDK